MEEIDVNELKKLIQSGEFDLELISFELDIPMEQLRQYERELKANKENDATRPTYTSTDISNKRNNDAHLKIEQMRKRYRQLFNGTSENRNDKIKNVDPKKTKELSQKDIELIESVIATVEEKIKEMQTLLKREKRKSAISILSELMRIEAYQLSMEHALKLYTLLNSEVLQRLNIDVDDSIDRNIKRRKNIYVAQFAKAIDSKQAKVEDIDELRNLESQITAQMAKENPLSAESIKRKITNRILAVQQQKALDRIRNDIPVTIASIITDLANGNMDIQRANAIIDEEAKRRVACKPRTNFSLTEEQERKQILIQIRTAIMEKADKYHIQDPEQTVLQLQELSSGELGMSIRVVVKNLMARRDFETAKSICDKFSSKDRESESSRLIAILKKEIRDAEISDVVLTVLNMGGTVEHERACVELIEKGLRTKNIKLGAISLGKSSDGLRNITLADVWENQKIK